MIDETLAAQARDPRFWFDLAIHEAAHAVVALLKWGDEVWIDEIKLIGPGYGGRAETSLRELPVGASHHDTLIMLAAGEMGSRLLDQFQAWGDQPRFIRPAAEGGDIALAEKQLGRTISALEWYEAGVAALYILARNWNLVRKLATACVGAPNRTLHHREIMAILKTPELQYS